MAKMLERMERTEREEREERELDQMVKPMEAKMIKTSLRKMLAKVVF